MILGTTLIVLLWAVFSLPVWANVVLTVLAAFWILFSILFFVYFFNIDMKLLAKMQDFLFKMHDKKKKNRRI